MISREKKISIVLIFFLFVLSMELRGKQGTGTGYRSYEDYIPERRKSGKRENKSAVKSRRKKHATAKNKKEPVESRPYKHYRVKRGDTLYRISKKFSIPVKEIVKVNRLKDGNIIRTDMKLKIPHSPGIEKRRIFAKAKNRKRRKKPGAPAFKWPLNRVINYHRDGRNGVRSIGLLIKGNADSKVYSSARGIVKKIGKMRGYGTYVVIMHKNRYVTVYSKLSSVNVREGKNLRKGEIIGYLDRNRTLHFQINQEGKSLNPLKYLNNRS